MGIHFQLSNFSKMVLDAPGQPVVLNDLDSITEQDRARIDQLTLSVYSQTDVFSNEPSCECGAISGAYNKRIVCNTCHTPVAERFSKSLTPRVWIRNPIGVALLINPMVWNMLSFKFTVSGFNLVEWLCNTDYVAPGNRPEELIDEVLGMGIQRGYNYFVNNFDAIIASLYTIKRFAKDDEGYLQRLLVEERDCVASTHLPLPNKALLIREDTNVGSYIDQTIVAIVDAIHTIKSIDTATSVYSIRQKENRTIKTIVKMARFYYESYHLMLAKKQGLIRRNICGTRCHWAGRAVISSNTGVHEYDELWLGWGLSVTLLAIHLKNKLFKLGYTPNSAASLLYEYTNKYNPLLDHLMQEVIAEAPNGRGLPCIFVRNPSLGRSSTQRMRVTRVKKDPDDQTIDLSILSVNGFNANKLALTSVMRYDNSPELLETP